MKDVTVRAYHPDDAARLAQIYREAVRVLGARHYLPDQVEAWLSIAPGPALIAGIYGSGRTAFVCEAGAGPVAFSDHDPTGHIRYFYCDPRYAGRGVADLLMDAIASSALRQGIDGLHAESSESALGFFRRHGFEVIGRRELDISGVAIHNYAVGKRLVAPSSFRRPGALQ
jgi:putative acetyltransferase